MKLVWTTVDLNLLQSASHPLFRLQVFSGCTSLCALTEEDSRAEISVILWASITGWWRWRWWWRCVCVCVRGAQRHWQKVKKGERHQRRVLWGRRHQCGPLFGCLMFLFSLSFALLLQVQKRPDMQRSRHRRGVFLTEGCLDSSPPLLLLLLCHALLTFPDLSTARDILERSHVWAFRTSSLPSCPARQAGCRLARRRGVTGAYNPIEMPAECLEKRQPRWSIRKLLIHYSQPSPSNHFKPTATVNCHQCRHWLLGLISVCLPCQINAFIRARCPRRRPQMNISCHL